MDNLIIIITTPHGICRDAEENLCDQQSMEASKQLYRTFINKGVKHIHHLFSTKHRSEIDENRVNNLRSEFEQKFKNLLNKISNSNSKFLV